MPQPPTSAASPGLQRTISLAGATALVVGGVVGAGIFVLVEKIGAQAGTAIWLSFVIAIAVSLVGVIPLIQLAGALPRAGAGYLFASRLLSPFWGVMVSLWVVLGGAASTSVVALTLSAYLQGYFAAEIPVSIFAATLLLAFFLVYQLGMRLAISLQLLMAIQFVVALLIYGVAGLFAAPVAVTLLPANGAAPFLMSILLAYSTCMGFQVIGEMGEEIHNARRNIPLSLLIGGALVAFIYILVGIVYVALPAPSSSLAAARHRPLSDSAATFLPGYVVRFIDIGALTAGLTSLNAAAIALPRELFAQARDGMLPDVLGKISPRTHTPKHAVTAYFLFVALLLLSGQGVNFFGCAAAIGILAISSVLGIAALRLPTRMPGRYEDAYIRFSPRMLRACATLTVLVSLGFAFVVAIEEPGVVLLYGAWTVLIAAYYAARTAGFRDADWQRIQAIPGVDEIDPDQKR